MRGRSRYCKDRIVSLCAARAVPNCRDGAGLLAV
jgi:hypothetical protein